MSGVKDLFGKMPKIDTVLLANPYSTINDYNMDGRLSEKDFFETLYYESDDSINLQNELSQDINTNNKNIFMISGYKGCGKTTFVNRLMLKCFGSNCSKQLINFEKRAYQGDDIIGEEINEIKELLKNIYEKKETKIKLINGLVSKTISRINPIKQGLSFRFLNLLDESKKDNDNTLLKFLNFIYYNKQNRNAIINLDITSNILELLEGLSQYWKCAELKEIDILKYIKRTLSQLKITDILLIITLWEISNKIFNNKIIFIFDNLEIINNIDFVHSFIDEFWLYYSDRDKILLKLDYGEINFNIHDDLYYFFVLRETTEAKINIHLTDLTSHIRFEDVSTIYPKNLIVNHRKEYFKDYIDGMVYKKIDDMSHLLEDNFFKNNIFSLFNNDYRTSISVITKVFNDNYNYYNEYQRIYDNTGDGKFAARGIIYRMILNILECEHTISNIANVVYCRKYKGVNFRTNTVRVLLQYLKAKLDNTGRLNIKNSEVSLYTIFSELKKIYDLPKICDALWVMYNFNSNTTKYFNHLITFTNKGIESKDDIDTQLISFKRGNQNLNEYSTIRLACSGLEYLEHVLVHYEYFSTKVFNNKTAPLICKENYVKKDNSYPFEYIINEIYNNAEDCCISQSQFIDYLFNYKMIEKDYYKKLFSYHKFDEDENRDVYTNNPSYYFHAERIINSHIGYLNAIRRSLKKHNLKNTDFFVIDGIFVDMIKRYISLCEKINYGDHTSYLLRLYKLCIEKVDEQRKHFQNDRDYITIPISKEEGEKYSVYRRT